MSIKQKLSFIILVIVAIILTANFTISYFSSKNQLYSEMVKKQVDIANQIGFAIKNSRSTSGNIQKTMGEKLRLVAIAAEQELNPDIKAVTNQELVHLSKKLGVTHITLFSQMNDEIVALKSSNSEEVNLRPTNREYYWFTAMDQLFTTRNVTIAEGMKLPNFWLGPYGVYVPDESNTSQWGYYYDGTTNYIINPYIINIDLKDFERITDTNVLLESTMFYNQDILEITGFNPLFISKETVSFEQQDALIKPLSQRGISFGQYKYKEGQNDVDLVQTAFQTQLNLTKVKMINGTRVSKSYIPLQTTPPIVVGIVTDYSIIQETLDRQIKNQILIAIALLMILYVACYYLASLYVRPLNKIMLRVNDISEGRFDNSDIFRHRKDEWGILAIHIKRMSQNLEANTTQLQHAVKELLSTKQYLESFFNHTSDSIHVIDLDGIVLQVNKAFENMYGWTKEETMFLPLKIVPEQYENEARRMMQLVHYGSQVSGFETVRQHKEGQLINVSLTVSPIRNDKGEIVAFATISRDITERKHTEELLRRSEKLSVVGQLAAGVAHEIRNPLTTLRGFVQLQKNKRIGNVQHLEIMLSELDRINFIVSEFLILAKPQVNHFQYHDLQQILQDIILLLDSQANMNNIQLHAEFIKDLAPINCEENQLKQVFINVIKNGMESMPSGGTIRIQVSNIGTTRVMVRIVDEGVGIAENQISRLGEPFFTNKDSGTGLGLMISQQIIANHKGNLLIRSELGIGTTVDIILPIGENFLEM